MKVVRVAQYHHQHPLYSAATCYQNILVTFSKRKHPAKRFFHFFSFDPNNFMLHHDRSVTLPGEQSFAYYSNSPKIYVIDSLELKKPVIVVVLDADMADLWRVEVYDFFEVKLLAVSEQPQKKFIFPTKQTFIQWKKHYIVDPNLRILTLKRGDTTRTYLSHRIEWKGSPVFQKHQIGQLFNLDDHLLLVIRFEITTSAEWSKPKDNVSFYTWDEEHTRFELTNVKLDLNNFRTKIGEEMFSALMMNGKLVTVSREGSVRDAENSQKRVFLWSMNGDNEIEIPAATGSLFVWNQFLFEIHSACVKKCWNSNGTAVPPPDLAIPSGFYVWGQYLAVFLSQRILVFQMDNRWETERLLWLAFFKNQRTSVLATLPKEILKEIIAYLRFQPKIAMLRKRKAE